MTLEQFTSEVYPLLPLKRKDTEEALIKIGLTKTDVGVLKKIFGFSVNNHKPRTTDEQKAEMAEMAERGFAHSEIAKKFNLSQTRVSCFLKRLGVEIQHHVKFTRIQDMKLKLLCEKKLPWKEIAMQMNMPYWKVRNHAQVLKLSNGRPSGFQKGNNGWAMRLAKKERMEKENAYDAL